MTVPDRPGDQPRRGRKDDDARYAPDLVRIPAGDFLMGASDAQEDERPVHRVYVSEFFIARFPVTQDGSSAVHPRDRPPGPVDPLELPLIASGGRDGHVQGVGGVLRLGGCAHPPAGHGSHPVVLVRYDDAVAYCRWLSDALGRVARLPSRSGVGERRRGAVRTDNAIRGVTRSSRHDVIFSPTQRSRISRGTRPTGTYPPNAYGLYSMAGNVWEWVADWYRSDYYSVR